MLAYYVEWHLRRAWAPLLFEDEERWEERKRRDPILPAKPSDSAERKKRSHQTADGLPVHSFESLLRELASRARVTYALKPQKAEEKTNLTFRQVPEPTPGNNLTHGGHRIKIEQAVRLNRLYAYGLVRANSRGKLPVGAI